MSYRTDVATIIMGLAEYYDKQLTDLQLAMYVEDLIDIAPHDLLQAVKLYRKSTNDRFPLPTKLRAMIELSDDQKARDAVARIIQALSNYCDPYGHSKDREDKAREFIGSLGWRLIERRGGWSKFSQTTEDSISTNAQAQWREFLISEASKYRLGIQNEAPTIEPRLKPLVINHTGSGLENLGMMMKIAHKETGTS